MIYIVTRMVEWGDHDEAGIVFYPNYFRWMVPSTRFAKATNTPNAACASIFQFMVIRFWLPDGVWRQFVLQRIGKVSISVKIRARTY